VHFLKAHAYGNDFLYVEKHAFSTTSPDIFTRQLCDRHQGIGADGLILYERTSDGASMWLLNADGSRAEVSGNGKDKGPALIAEALNLLFKKYGKPPVS